MAIAIIYFLPFILFALAGVVFVVLCIISLAVFMTQRYYQFKNESNYYEFEEGKSILG